MKKLTITFIVPDYVSAPGIADAVNRSGYQFNSSDSSGKVQLEYVAGFNEWTFIASEELEGEKK